MFKVWLCCRKASNIKKTIRLQLLHPGSFISHLLWSSALFTRLQTLPIQPGEKTSWLSSVWAERERSQRKWKKYESQESENEPPKLCEDVEDVPVSKCDYENQESVISYTAKPLQALFVTRVTSRGFSVKCKQLPAMRTNSGIQKRIKTKQVTWNWFDSSYTVYRNKLVYSIFN